MRRASLTVLVVLACFTQVLMPLQASAAGYQAMVFDAPLYSTPLGVAFGPDGNIWFTEYSLGKIGSITPAGGITEFPVPSGDRSVPTAIASGPDGNLWFTELDKIGKISPAGSFSEYPLPHSGDVGPISSIAAGPDGNLWFTESGANLIGRITPSGTISEFPVPTPDGGPWSITAGADGNLWFSEQRAHKIGRVSPTGEFAEFSIPSNSSPQGITSGPDGNVWFVGKTLGRVEPSGAITEFPVPVTPPMAIASGSDGNLWFTTSSNKIGRATPEGTISMVPVPDNGYRYFITGDSDGNIWYSNFTQSKIVRITPPASDVSSDPSSDVSVTMVASPKPVQANGSLTYTLTVGNAGPDNAESVNATQSLPSGAQFISATPSQGTCTSSTSSITCDVGTIASQGSATITVIVHVAAPAGSTLQSSAAAAAAWVDPNPNDNTASDSTDVVARPPGPSADLSLSMAAAPKPVRHNGFLTYTLTVGNAGPDYALYARTNQTLPSGTHVVSINSPGACTSEASGISCYVGTLASGGSVTITVVVNVTAPAGSTLQSTATASSASSDANPGNNTAVDSTSVVASSADAQVSVSDSPDPVQRNKKLTYTISARNAGPDPAESVVVSQQLPAHSQFVSATPTQGSCSTPPAGGTGTVICSLGTLANGATAGIRVVVTVTANDGTSVRTTVTISADGLDPDPSNNSATESTKVCGLILLGMCF